MMKETVSTSVNLNYFLLLCDISILSRWNYSVNTHRKCKETFKMGSQPYPDPGTTVSLCY